MPSQRRNPLAWLARISYDAYVRGLAIALAAAWLVLAIRPRYRSVWLLENAVFLAFVVTLALLQRRLRLSRVSLGLIFLYLCLHLVGAHYSYAETPYRSWLQALPGVTLEGGRNHYDRIVHFCYGLLLAYPARELFLRVAEARGFWGYFLPFDVVLSTSLLYELLEWAAAVLAPDGPSRSFVAAQGDPWDAQKDMALAALGALLAMTATALVNLRLRRDFAREWSESLRVKRARPLGEEALASDARRRGQRGG
jgi:putative membrane protein